jgi:hypothetical protein
MLARLGKSSIRTALIVVALIAAVMAGRSPTATQALGSDEQPAAKEPATADSAEQIAARKLLREQSAERIKGVRIKGPDTETRGVELLKEPLITYTDEPLCINAATVWTWTAKKDGRPLALCKVEHYDIARLARAGEWLYCFTSLAPDLIHAEWSDGHQWTARKPGVSFQSVPDAGAPGETPAARLRQMKELSRQFTAAFDFNQKNKEELRLLARPLYRYADSDAGIIDGAVFAAAMNGTNPTAIFLIEVQQQGEQKVWRFGVAAMTDGAVVVKYDGKEVWSKPALHAPGTSFDNWTYFFENAKRP